MVDGEMESQSHAAAVICSCMISTNQNSDSFIRELLIIVKL